MPLLRMCARLVLPAHAGMARWGPRSSPAGPPFSPHTRGWPELHRSRGPGSLRSPRTRGDGPQSAGMARKARGWPAKRISSSGTGRSSPRTRGDGPFASAWIGASRQVLPAHAGMARMLRLAAEWHGRFSPHTRGWPEQAPGVGQPRGCSPRTRGDGPDLVRPVVSVGLVLPAHAGMARIHSAMLTAGA